MKKLLLILVLVAALAVLVVTTVSAGMGKDKWERVASFWSENWGNYKVSPNGVVHEMWGCDANYLNCDNEWNWFPKSRFQEPVECDSGYILITSATPFFGFGDFPRPGDEADVSDFLSPETEYWVCVNITGEGFRVLE